MKTKLVRPVLVESKERTDIWWSGHKMYYNRTPKEPRTPCYQLILISLEDEKIEVGDKIYHPNTGLVEVIEIERLISYSNYKFKTVDERCWICDLTNETKKVIATQSQLSPEYIQQAISEFNDGGMKDVEIETEKRFLGYEDISGLPMFDDIVIPKLTNGYVTIVNTMKAEEKLQQAAVLYKQNKIKSELDDHFDAFMAGAKSPESLEYWKEKEKLYSEEEVAKIVNKAFFDARLKNKATDKVLPSGYISGERRRYTYPDSKEWFTQHKK